MTEKQVLFRIDAKLLESLDKKIAKDGFTTRNAWFKQAVQDYAARGGASAASRRAPTAAKRARRTRG